MTKIITPAAALVPELEEREFAAGTTVTHVEGLADYATEAKAAIEAAQKRHLRTESVTLPDGTVVETVKGVDFSIRIKHGRRDRSVTE